MKIQQLSIFIENKPGHIGKAVKVLGDSGINLVTLSLADTEQYGILRIVVKDWERARDLLAAAGFMVKVTDVLAIEVKDRPGGLQEILEAVEAAKLNIEYMYAFTAHRDNAAILLFRFADTEAAVKALEGNPAVSLVNRVELFK
ncbi:MAG: amino acid-binding protein [Planctomycetes bacterium]|nr:amino acid-binding protein [Planctomycetota bacterium]